MFRLIAFLGPHSNVGFENELSALFTHKTKLVGICICKSAAEWPFLYAILDTFLWVGLLVLIINFVARQLTIQTNEAY
jgi:hypothetical protein